VQFIYILKRRNGTWKTAEMTNGDILLEQYIDTGEVLPK